MVKYKENIMKWISLILESNEKKIILIMHDKCIFYLNDSKWEVWAKSKELSLHKKKNRCFIMVSKFLIEECGWLKLNL